MKKVADALGALALSAQRLTALRARCAFSYPHETLIRSNVNTAGR